VNSAIIMQDVAPARISPNTHRKQCNGTVHVALLGSTHMF